MSERVGSLDVVSKVLDPMYALAPFVLLLASIPLAFIAVVTTSIAVSLLAFRAAIVYVQLAVALVGAWVNPLPPKLLSSEDHSLPPSTKRTSPNRQRQHRGSSESAASSQETIVPAKDLLRLPNRTGSLSTFLGTSDMTRDFEGVGGWRVAGDDDEEALWMGMNSRLQLPAHAPMRRHHRSLTAGTSPGQRWSWSPEALRMSPVQSRARTPGRFAADEENDYFPIQVISGPHPMDSASQPTNQHKRRKSGSGSSCSTSTSSSLRVFTESGG